MKFILPFFAAIFLLSHSENLEAQVLVYKIDFDQSKGINYHPFEGGFFVAPLLGGEGSFLLTSTDGPFTFTTSSNGGKLFTAVTAGGDKKAVVSATTGSGTAGGSIVATGDINRTLKVNSPTQSLTLKVAKLLTGTALSADDESTASAPAIDGSIGSAGVSEIKLTLDEAETNRANDRGLSLSQTVDQLKLVLEQKGFTDSSATPSTGTTPTPTTDPATTTPTSTTGSSSGG